jgi:HD-like signal output (HDOD) protein
MIMGNVEAVKRKILMGVEKTPSFSPAVSKIIEKANDNSISPRELNHIIKSDPVLTGKILKLVNSSYFSIPNKVANITRSLVLLGFNTIKNIAISTEFVQLTEGAPKNKYFDYNDLWEHMISVGVTARLIAKESKQPREQVEEYFIGGLIHNIGDLLIMRHAQDEYHMIHEKAKEYGLSVNECCKKVLGFSAPEIGLKLADHWKLQDQLKKSIYKESNEKDSHLGLAVKVADKYARSKEIGYVKDFEDCDIHQSEYQDLSLNSDFFAISSDRIFEEINKARIFVN